MKPAAGVIGLGIMGGAFARHISEKGFDVFGYDISEETSRRASADGVTLMTSASDVAQNSKSVICSLPSASALKEVAEEIASSVSNKCIVVEASTFTISDKEKARDILESAGHTLLDCPVSGTGQQAKTGDLAVFTSGHKDSVVECLPVIEAFSRENKYCGPFGAGSKMKFVANHLVTVHNTAAAEAMVLGMKSGLDPALIFDVISTSAATSRMFQVRGKMMSDNKYDEVGMSNRLYQKDLDIISAFAAEVGCPVNLFMAAVQPYRATLAQGLGEKDTAAVCAVLEDQARVER
ncbi:MAG: NAD(P)-dependent oxidoreductase [Pseudomonadota bacterium]|nr:NAD(P)-dependent oxidoreductase [Pseudomonadota bacterium]